ncbi:nucleotidyltransferase domain-containing protein [Candidatus Woesearchaeota archaeon]|nr:nucleotidyltransferase domain-containing protein [Candidatus Woesearchaeota archaeon]
MTAKTKVEKEAMIMLVKDFTADYNPSSLAKELGVTRVGTFKALKGLENEGLVKGRTLGKARFYAVDLKDEYARKNAEILLMEQSRAYQRWVDEFEELFDHVKIAVLFGSIIKNKDKANDIDILLVFDIKNNSKINSIIKEKNEVLTRRIHPVKQTMGDLRDNIRKKDKVILNALKEGVILHGFESLLEVIKNVSNRE